MRKKHTKPSQVQRLLLWLKAANAFCQLLEVLKHLISDYSVKNHALQL